MRLPVRRQYGILGLFLAAVLAAGCNDGSYHRSTSSYVKPEWQRRHRYNFSQDPFAEGALDKSVRVADGGGGGGSDDSAQDTLLANQKDLDGSPVGSHPSQDSDSGSSESSDAITADQTADPLGQQYDITNDTYHAQTDHTHWVRGQVTDGTCTVYVNGVQLVKVGTGTGVSKIDKDITTSFHKGTNTVSFYFTPSTPGGAADLDVLESEHDPPIAPMASFDSRTLLNPNLDGSAHDQRQTFVVNAL